MIIDQLRSEIRRHDLLYYVHNRPEISDSEYDRLFAELGRLEAERPELVTPDSPTQRVSERPLEAFASLTHAVPMLSINSVYDESGVRGFCKAAGDAELVAEPKIDGLAVSLIYEGGKLVRAATRGDGKTGDDVTANARTIKTIPLSISYADWIEVRGEVYIPLSKFSAAEFSSPRSAAVGSLKTLDPKVTANRGLAFMAYGSSACSTQIESLSMLAELGFKVVPCKVVSAKEAIRYRMPNIDAAVDGYVVKVNRVDLRKSFGETRRAPKWCVAFKHGSPAEETTVLSIEIRTGNTGRQTPVVNFEPVELCGATVRKASLGSVDNLRTMDIQAGDTVLVERVGGCVPQIVGVTSRRKSA